MKITQVDAFTTKPFTGNPAAVCVLKEPADEVWMQNVAAEMNLAETAFLYPYNDGYNLRWFTPEVEVKLCGHATLASAHVLWEDNFLPKNEKANFYTLSGKLEVVYRGEWMEMDFPAIEVKSVMDKGVYEKVFGVALEEVRYHEGGYTIAMSHSEQDVRNLKPDFSKLKELKAGLIMLTSKGKEFDFVSRVFAPDYGINEDPVTGSAHCCLTAFWSEKTGRKEFTAWQASKRGGLLKLKLDGSRVKLIGQAVTVMRGELLG